MTSRSRVFLLILSGSIGFFSCLDQGVAPPPPATPPVAQPEVGILYNVAGFPRVWGDSGDGGPSMKAQLAMPCDVTIAPDGAVLVSDWGANRIRRITSDGLINAFIGSGGEEDGLSGPGVLVDIYHPGDIKLGPDMSWYVTAMPHTKIKRFSGPGLECSLFAGTTWGYGGDNGAAIQAQFRRPSRMAFDLAGNLYLADEGNLRIRRIDRQTATITTLAGGTWGSRDGVGDSAQFSFQGDWSIRGGGPPGGGMDISPDGRYLFVADGGNNKIRRIDLQTRMVTTIAGTGMWGYSGDGGPAISAEMLYPFDVEVSQAGDLYIAEAGNHVIRRVDPWGIITTVAGNGVPGFSPDSTNATEASLLVPHGVAFDDETNTLYLADTNNGQIKRVRIR